MPLPKQLTSLTGIGRPFTFPTMQMELQITESTLDPDLNALIPLAVSLKNRFPLCGGWLRIRPFIAQHSAYTSYWYFHRELFSDKPSALSINRTSLCWIKKTTRLSTFLSLKISKSRPKNHFKIFKSWRDKISKKNITVTPCHYYIFLIINIF